MGERVLTVRDRIIVHLSVYNRFADDFECPEEMCQSGISAAIEKSRAHVTLELNRMKSDGLVSERVAHVNGAKSRRKTYSLTQKGTALNADITGYLESMNIEIIDSEGTKIFSGIGAADYLRTNFKMLHVTAVDRVIASGGILNVRTQPALTQSQASLAGCLPPRPEGFVERRELGELQEALGSREIIAVMGIPGIGKTALLSELAWRLPEDEVYFRRLYSYDTLNSVVADMGNYMERRGHPSVRNYLANSDALDLPEVASHLAGFLKQSKTVMIYDEFDQASEVLKDYFSMLAEIMRGTGSKLVLASSKKPKFYGQKNIVLEKRVSEITLAPLDEESSSLLLQKDAASIQNAANLRLAGGHPLTLKLLASGMPSSNLAEFVDREILGGDPELAKLCRFASVMRKPFNPDDLELLGLGSASEIRENPVFEKHPNNGFLTHPAISALLNGAMSKRMLKEMHTAAAKYYLDAEEDLHEAIYHLAEAGEFSQAKDLVISHWDELSDSGDREGLAGCLERLAVNKKNDDWKLMELAANAYDQAGLWARAAELALKIEKETPETPEAFRAMILRSRILAKTGRTEEAINVLDAVLKSEKQLDSDIAGQAHYAKTCALRRLDRLGPALKECGKALDISKKSGNSQMHSRSLMECAMILSAKGQHQAAIEKLTEAGNVFEQKNTLQDRIRLGINRGMVLKSLSRNDEAVAELEKAVKLAEDAGLSRLHAHGLANLTELLNIRKDYRRSADLAKQACGIFSVLGEPVMIAASKFNLGAALAGLGKKKDAIQTMDEAVSILEKNGLTKARASWIGDYAEILNGIGEEDKAARLLDTHGI